jgi:type VII secretion integral membrane protein EccD
LTLGVKVAVHSGVGLTRLVVYAPRRRMDVAFPDQVPLVHLLPTLLRNAGEELADQGQQHEGWLLRRADGDPLDPAGTFSAQQVRDGDSLYLVPRRMDWPDSDYDDVVDAIASGARQRGRRWSGGATRVAGLAVAVVALLAALAEIALSGPPWTVPAAVTAAVAAALLLAGTVLSRALHDASAGAVVAAMAMPFALLGGALLFARESLDRLGAPHLLAGSALLVLAAALGHLGTAEYGRVFVTGATVGGLGLAGAAVAYTSLSGTGAAALVVAVALLVSPLLPAIAVRVGQIPLPQLPRTAEDLVRDDPLPDLATVRAATARADETLTGLLSGVALATVICFAVLARSGSTAALLLTGVVTLAYPLRARFHVGVRHRVPMLITGVVGAALLAVLPEMDGATTRLTVALPVALAVAAIAMTAGLTYANRLVAPRMGRFADILDVVLTLAVLPLVCSVLGLFGFMRGFGG